MLRSGNLVFLSWIGVIQATREFYRCQQ